MMWLLLAGWMVIAVVASTVCGRVLSVSAQHHPPVDGAPVVPAASPHTPLSTI